MNVIFFLSHPLVDKLAEECIQLTPAFDIKLFENERDEDFAVFEDPDEAPNPFIGGNNFQTLVRFYLAKCEKTRNKKIDFFISTNFGFLTIDGLVYYKGCLYRDK